MSPSAIIILIAGYFTILLFVAWLTGKKADNAGFFIGNRRSPWFIVAIGMIGASISGVTFISVPGWVGTSQFSYMQVVLGYMLGYLVIGTILMPMYYRMNLTSIYTYLNTRFGIWSHKTGVFIFLVSRTFGSAARLYLVANVLHYAVFEKWDVPFIITVVVSIMLIYLYTFKGGIKTIIWTDTLQAILFLVSLIISIIFISRALNLSGTALINALADSHYTRIFFFDNWQDKHWFFKHFFGGMFIAIAMTGLDQDMMQKNLSCKNIKDAQKNMFWFSLSLLPVNLLFLSLGALLYMFLDLNMIPHPADTDTVFPFIATGNYFGPVLAFCFIMGIIAAAYSSADSALTALTTSFTFDILNAKDRDEKSITRIRKRVHFGFALVTMAVIGIFRIVNDRSVIDAIFTVAGYTYGPLLGLFAFGLLTRYKLNDSYRILIAVIASPLLCYILSANSADWFAGYKFGYELLILNGLITFLLLLLFRKRPQ